MTDLYWKYLRDRAHRYVETIGIVYEAMKIITLVERTRRIIFGLDYDGNKA